MDDNAMSRQLLQQLVRTTPALELVGALPDARQVPALLARQPVDVLLLDVEMPYLSGLDLIRQLGAAAPSVVLVTASPEYEREARALRVADFLLKPLGAGQFRQSMARLLAYVRARGGAD
ncbi:LytR/AlgR family response regulator transcription factor [Hymenobacter latericus]|uniref:LytR/AlgR family response regulator transcription factor n=1 Tax=Hymenobacter sp. YIM 151858-1 TaxID=2987688 RepID=UPI0022262AA1|nr:response regulator [Hymenobacter sp. YIM 151858-1]UYZ61245.1 response regulator [Hymenobacter sp. YIM 151858-1]